MERILSVVTEVERKMRPPGKRKNLKSSVTTESYFSRIDQVYQGQDEVEGSRRSNQDVFLRGGEKK